MKYCEGTNCCRHEFIRGFFGEGTVETVDEVSAEHGVAENRDGVRGCDYACDYCKDSEGLKERKKEGLASEEWVSTQRQRDGDGFYGGGSD